VASTFFLPVLGKAIGTPKLLLILAAGSVLGGVTTWLFRVETTNQSLTQDA
jgi:membrane protein YqaA with SNARE-associated domain